MIDRMTRHVFEEHTGEVRVRIEATTLAALFEEAARALAELMLGDVPCGQKSSEQLVNLDSKDCAMLLVDWLNELIFLSETRKEVYTDVRVENVSERHLEARIRGVCPQALRTAVKAATLHELTLEPTPSGFRAGIVLDV